MHSLEKNLGVKDLQPQTGHLEAQIDSLEQELETTISVTWSPSSQPESPVQSDDEEDEVPPLWAYPMILEKVEHKKPLSLKGEPRDPLP